MVFDRQLFGRRIIIGYNTEKTLRFGVHKEVGFTAVGIWPLIIGVETRRIPATLVVVLNDGETYTNIEGCTIMAIPDHILDKDAEVDWYVKYGPESRIVEWL